jgi:hypothetical protein
VRVRRTSLLYALYYKVVPDNLECLQLFTTDEMPENRMYVSYIPSPHRVATLGSRVLPAAFDRREVVVARRVSRWSLLYIDVVPKDSECFQRYTINERPFVPDVLLTGVYYIQTYYPIAWT